MMMRTEQTGEAISGVHADQIPNVDTSTIRHPRTLHMPSYCAANRHGLRSRQTAPIKNCQRPTAYSSYTSNALPAKNGSEPSPDF